jgi:short-subunit dehydrogenase
MNVASIAGFMPGPLMSTYYATKSYVIRLTEAIKIELKKQHSKVKVSVLCPGPVDTNFNKVANVEFPLKGQSSKKTASKAINKMLKNKFMIFTSFPIKALKNIAKIFPELTMGKFSYNAQKGKLEK